MENKTYNCSAEVAIEIIGGKWKLMILWWLNQKTYRFAELRREIPGISEKMLIQHLKQLEADGIVERKVFATVPPKVEYSLTMHGKSLRQALNAISDWGKAHIEQIGANCKN